MKKEDVEQFKQFFEYHLSNIYDVCLQLEKPNKDGRISILAYSVVIENSSLKVDSSPENLNLSLKESSAINTFLIKVNSVMKTLINDAIKMKTVDGLISLSNKHEDFKSINSPKEFAEYLTELNVGIPVFISIEEIKTQLDRALYSFFKGLEDDTEEIKKS